MLKSHWCVLVGLVGSLSLASGCTSGPKLPPTVTAEGVVTLDGKTVDQATVVFIADQGTYNATGVTDANGKFSLKAFDEKKGAVPGSYKVEINKTIVEQKGQKGGETLVNLVQGLPKKYSSMATSGLTYTIPDKGSTTINFELKSK